MKRPRRNHKAGFKAKVALAALKDDKTLEELAEKFDVHANQISQWKAPLLEAATGVFLTPGEKRESVGPSMVGLKYSTPTREVSSRVKASPRCSRTTMLKSAWMAKVGG